MKGIMSLTVRELRAARQRKSSVNHETYKQLWTLAQQRIRARDEAGLRHLVFEIPPLVPGRPVFKPSHAARYVAAKLRRGGFRVEEMPLSLHVAWDDTPAERAARAGRTAKRRAVERGSGQTHGAHDGVTYSGNERRGRGGRAGTRPVAASEGLPLSVNEATRRLERLKAVLALSR